MRGGSASGVVVETLGEMLEGRREAAQFVYVQCRQSLQAAVAFGGKADADDSAVGVALVSDDEPGGCCAIDKFDGAVRTKNEVLRDFADRRAPTIGVSFDGEHELVLRGAESDRFRLPLAPTFEAAQVGPKRQQAREVTPAELGHDSLYQ
jgi:hypothetical protein